MRFNKVIIVLSVLWAILISFFLGRFSGFYYHMVHRVPIRQIPDSNVKVPVVTIKEYTDQSIQLITEFRQSRFYYRNKLFFPNAAGMVIIPRGP